MRIDDLEDVTAGALETLRSLQNADWSVPAGVLTWSCWQTADHVVDVLFSYALQVAAAAPSDWLALQELHARPDATPTALVDAVDAVARTLITVLRAAPSGARAWHSFGLLDLAGWAGLAANELAVHTYDVAAGLGRSFSIPDELSGQILAATPMGRDERAQPRWTALLAIMGRPTPDDGA